VIHLKNDVLRITSPYGEVGSIRVVGGKRTKLVVNFPSSFSILRDNAKRRDHVERHQRPQRGQTAGQTHEQTAEQPGEQPPLIVRRGDAQAEAAVRRLAPPIARLGSAVDFTA
jgi:hypothetical protein